MAENDNAVETMIYRTSRLPNSVVKVSIGRLPLFLPQQQDHRTDGRWNSTRRVGNEGKKWFQERNRWFRSLAQSITAVRRTGTFPFSKFQISLGRISSTLAIS